MNKNTRHGVVGCETVPELVLVFKGEAGELEDDGGGGPDGKIPDELDDAPEVGDEERLCCEAPKLVELELDDGLEGKERETLGVATLQNCCISCSAVPRSCEQTLFVHAIICDVNWVTLRRVARCIEIAV